MCGPYSAHSPFAQSRQFAVLAVAWTIADLAGRSMRHCHVGECGRPGRIRGVTTATPSYKGHRSEAIDRGSNPRATDYDVTVCPRR